MSASRLAAWIVVVAVGSAWLASAAGVGRRSPRPRTAPPTKMDAELTALAADVQTQAARLRDRLALAPAPAPEQRNPFSFAPRPVPLAQVAPAAAPVATAGPIEPAEPTLTLIGIAEMAGASGVVRTAMITSTGTDLIMATAGQTILSRYQISAIGPDAVQLKELTTGAARTLVLR